MLSIRNQLARRSGLRDLIELSPQPVDREDEPDPAEQDADRNATSGPADSDTDQQARKDHSDRRGEPFRDRLRRS